ncbi:MAG: hypothetical protein SOZ86_08045, partial [Bacteroidaceae bacterium]|nr:hypothetical protein [Bacteroidaceae bacterium]
MIDYLLLIIICKCITCHHLVLPSLNGVRKIITQGNHPEAKSLTHTVAEKKEDTIIKKDEGKGK